MRQETVEGSGFVDRLCAVLYAELAIDSAANYTRIRQLKECLSQTEDLKLLALIGSDTKCTDILVSAMKPLPLTDLLREMPPVEWVLKKDRSTLEVALNS